MPGRPSPGESRNRQVRRAPEEMHRTALANELRAKLVEDTTGLHEDSPEPVGVLRIVAAMRLILVEWDRVGHLVGASVQGHPKVERFHFLHEAPVERGHRLRLECQNRLATIGRLHDQLMSEKIEINLE